MTSITHAKRDNVENIKICFYEGQKLLIIMSEKENMKRGRERNSLYYERLCVCVCMCDIEREGES